MIRTAMALPETEGPAPMRFVRNEGRGLARRATIVLEDGSERRAEGELPLDLPIGYHTLHEEGAPAVSLVVSPRACPLPDRMWGLAVQLHGARSRSSWGIGDLGDLRRLGEYAARDLGATVLLVNPLGAPLPLDDQQPSPYFASSRRYKSPLYLRVEDIDHAGVDIEAAARAGRELNGAALIDRNAIWRVKKQALETIFAAKGRDPALATWRAEQGPELERYARFCALAEHFACGWRRFPEPYRHPDRPEVGAFADEREERVRFFAWLQWLLDRQLADASRALRVVHDLPIGFDGEGADGWAFQDCLAFDVAIGAPADPFNERGQEWGLPPFIPWKLRAAGYRPFIETLRAGFAHGGGLRIDHVMGLFRMFWVPRGVEPREGTYVHYPAEDLLDLLALEAARAGAFVVGEDLGTVPPGVREELWHRNILSYRLLWFEPAPPEQWPERAMAAVTTHDLPTVPGLWSGADLADQRHWGFDTASDDELRHRLAERGSLSREASEADAVRGAYRALARAPSRIVLASLEDLLLVRERPNLPGSTARPNWCYPLPIPLDDIGSCELVREVSSLLARGHE